MKFKIYSASRQYSNFPDSVSIPQVLYDIGLSYEQRENGCFVELTSVEDFLKLSEECNFVVYGKMSLSNDDFPTIVLYDDYME